MTGVRDGICLCGHDRRAHGPGGVCIAATEDISVTRGSVCSCNGYQAATSDQAAGTTAR